MSLIFSPEQKALIAQVRKVLPDDQELFLVGGAVRDALLGEACQDFDFALDSNPTTLAKKLARVLDAGFFVLDDERHTTRVLVEMDDGNHFPIDFVEFTGNDLTEDLYHRDFTMNAMAVSVRDLGALIDPFHGQKNLQEGVLQVCNDLSLLDDPVRVLRGIRLAIQFDLKYAEGVDKLMRVAAMNLPRTSYERQRDAFFKILEGADPYQGIKDCYKFDVFKTLIPGLEDQFAIPASAPHLYPLFEHTCLVMKYLKILLCSGWVNEWSQGTDSWWLTHFRTEFEPFLLQIKKFFTEEITPGRSKYGLVMLGALLHDVGKPETQAIGEDGLMHFYNHEVVGAELALDIAEKLKLSNAEAEWVAKLVRYHMGLLSWTHSDEDPSRKSIYRFFRNAEDAGVAIALMFLADQLGTYGEDIPVEKWQKDIAVVKTLLSAWWENKDQIIFPKPLLDGDDLQENFDLQPGKRIGQLLQALLEAQASGEVSTVEEAKAFIQSIVNQ